MRPPIALPAASGAEAERAAAAAASEAAVPRVPAKGERIRGRRLYHQPLSYLVSRSKPWDPRFWAAVSKRVRPKVEELAGRRSQT